MVKFSSVFFAVAVVVNAVPSLAHLKENRREISEEGPVLSREIIEAVYGRELIDVELQERAPFFPFIAAALRIGAKVGSKIARKVGRKAAHHAADHHNNNNNHHRRSLDLSDYLDDLLERDNFYDEALEGRDLGELD